MRIYIDLDTRRILLSPTRPATRLEFKRRDNDAFEVQFLRAGAVQELPAGTSARVGLKATNDFAGEFLATDTLTQSGTGSETIYSGDFNLNTVALEELFPDEPASITAMLEVEWTTGTQVGSSLTLPVIVYNDVIRGDEGDPAHLPLFYTSETPDFLATQSEAESGTDNTKWMSPLRTAQAIAALAATDWDSVSDKPETFPPASHTHPQSDITGLDTALLGKASATHTHPLSDLTQSSATTGQVATFNGSAWVPQDPSGGGGGVSSYLDLTDVPATFPPEAHTHAISEVTNLQTALDGKAASSHTHAAADITSGTLAIDRIPTGTTSSTVALGNHTHAIADVTDLQTALDGKQSSGSYVTTSGGITEIAVVATMPAAPDPNTLYIVTA
jgi:hypothetical protein